LNAKVRLHSHKFSLTCNANKIFKFSDEEAQENFCNQGSEDRSESFSTPFHDQKEAMLTGISTTSPILHTVVAG
jgi:hypothetical protein